VLFCDVEIICSSYIFFINNPDPKMYSFLKIGFFAIFRLSADLQFKGSFHITKFKPDPNPDPKSRLETESGPGGKKINNFGSTTLV
jgi:hypothetical protein